MSKKNRVLASADLKNDEFLKKHVIITKMPKTVMEIVKDANSKTEFAENENFYNENIKPEAEQVIKTEAEQVVKQEEVQKETFIDFQDIINEVAEQVIKPEADQVKETEKTPEPNFLVLLQELENRLKLVEEENKTLKQEQKTQITFEEMQERLLKIKHLEANKQTFEEKRNLVNEISFDDKDEAFDNKFYKLKLFNYKDTAVFSISNNLILNEFKLFTLDKINLKLEEIEKEIKELKTF